MDDLYFFCRKLKLKEYFHGGDSYTDKIQQEERCYLNTKLPNCYFNPNHETPLNLQRYISIVKKEITELLKKPNYQQSNLTSDERLKLRYLSENRNLTIKGADKGGKIVIMDTAEYIEHCELLLNDREFYEKLHADPTLIYTEESKQKIDGMLKNKYITKQEYNIYLKIWRTHELLYFTDYQRYIKYLIHFNHYDLSSLALISAHAISQNLLILS